jgi:hypothetical protein
MELERLDKNELIQLVQTLESYIKRLEKHSPKKYHMFQEIKQNNKGLHYYFNLYYEEMTDNKKVLYKICKEVFEFHKKDIIEIINKSLDSEALTEKEYFNEFYNRIKTIRKDHRNRGK